MNPASDPGDGEQLLHGHGAVCGRRPDGQDLRPEEAGREGGAALHPADPLRRGAPAQTRHCAQVTTHTHNTRNTMCLTSSLLLKLQYYVKCTFLHHVTK